MKQHKSTILLCAAIMALAGCAADSGSDDIKPQASAEVAFGAYSGRYANTRATTSGNIAQDDLQRLGFGVFAFSTSTSRYSTGSLEPNFMYNQLVADTTATGKWSYSPIRYWPTSNIAADGTATPQFVSFFAYAPRTSATSIVTGASGITGFTANTSTDDPTVSYKLGTDSVVDLLWGSGSKGYALINQTIDTPKVSFYFHHALTKIGGSSQDESQQTGLTIALDIDDDGNIAGGTTTAANTKVTITRIKLEVVGMQPSSSTSTDAATSTVYSSGRLNLATGKWTMDDNDLTAIDTTSGKQSQFCQLITVADSAKTLKADGTINSSMAEPGAGKYVDDALMPNGKRLLWDSIPQGVTTTQQNVFQAEAMPLLIMPSDEYKPVLRLTVSYVIRTLDPWLLAGHSDMHETLTRTFALSQVPLSAHRYNIAIKLGMHQLRLDGNLDEWEVTHGSLIFDKTTQQWQQGPDIREDNPSGQDTTWMAKRHIF